MSTSLDQALELRGIEMQAYRDGGRDALGILKYLADGDGNRMVLKGILCLQAYHNRLSTLSVTEAENIIAADDAGRIVHDWVSQPNVWKKIVSNHEDSKTLLQLVTYILVGARQTATIETWMGGPRNIGPKTIPEVKAIGEQFKWKSIMMWLSTKALISWHPEGLADYGYDFFSRKFDESWLNPKLTGDFHSFSEHLWLCVMTALKTNYISNKHAASSRSFERCANRMVAFWRLCCPPGQTFSTGFMALKHPNRPSADRFLTACREIYRDRDHPLRSYYQISASKPVSSKYDYARFLQAMGYEASNFLNGQGRFDEGALVLKIVHRIWGRDSEFLNSDINLYPERLEKWKQRNQEIMKTLHPKFYTPFVF
ncbi:hypothetical protein F5B21DRAFT_501110 [Xylaria acuta]|nr:hypothetical protein F5B21DRAFT_501110 [Xylaria acuta]